MSVFISDISWLNFTSNLLDQSSPKVIINEQLVQCGVSLISFDLTYNE